MAWVENFLTGDRGDLSLADMGSRESGEWSEVVWQAPRCRVERIVSVGHVSPEGFWYDQAEGEFVLVMQGGAVLEYDNGETQEMGPGDWAVIPAHRRHRVAWTSMKPPCVWLCVFSS